MKPTEITDLIIEYLEADFETAEDEDGSQIMTEYDFDLARKAVEKQYPQLGPATVGAIFMIVKRHVSVTWNKWNERGGVCYEPEFDIDKRADEKIDSLISFKRKKEGLNV